jgi:integrase
MRSLQLNEVAQKLGMRVYCNKCKSHLTLKDINAGTQKKDCSHPANAQRYKAVICVRISGQKKRRTCCFKTRNLNEAIDLTFKFKMYAKTKAKETHEPEMAKPVLLIDCLVWFLDYKKNIGVKGHLKKDVSTNAFSAYKNNVNKWKEATKKAGEDFKTLKVDKISDKNVCSTIDYLNQWSTSTQRKAFGFYNQFYNFLNENGYNIPSPFKNIQVAEVSSKDARALTFDEFKTVKKAMENGTSSDKENGKIRFFDWLPDALTFNALTGRRREEFMTAKFSDIVLVDGQLLGGYIKLVDYKYSRQNSHKVAFQNRITKAPIYPELYDFLMKMGYEKHKNTDRYIIAGDETKQRDTMANNLTNGFAFYRKKAGYSSDVQLNGLRKKYITRMRNEFGDNSNFFTGHKSSRIDMKHYYDDSELFEKVKSFVLWK